MARSLVTGDENAGQVIAIDVIGRSPLVVTTGPEPTPALMSPNALYVNGAVAETGNGSAVAPFRTFTEATNAVQDGGTIVIFPGDYTSEGAVTIEDISFNVFCLGDAGFSVIGVTGAFLPQITWNATGSLRWGFFNCSVVFAGADAIDIHVHNCIASTSNIACQATFFVNGGTFGGAAAFLHAVDVAISSPLTSTLATFELYNCSWNDGGPHTAPMTIDAVTYANTIASGATLVANVNVIGAQTFNWMDSGGTFTVNTFAAPFYDAGGGSISEAAVQVRFPRPGRLSRMTVRIVGGNVSGANLTLTFRLNGVNQTLTVTVPIGSDTGTNVADFFEVLSTSLVAILIDATGTPVTPGQVLITAQYAAG